MKKQKLKAARPERVTDLPRYNSLEFDNVTQVLAIIKELERGQLSNPAALESTMRRDDRITGCLQSRTRALGALPFVPETADDSPKARELADDVQLNFWRWFSPTDVAEVMAHGLLLGQCFGRIEWEVLDGKWNPSLKIWNQENFYWDWTARHWKVRTAEGVFEVTPGDGQWFQFAPFGFDWSFRQGLMRNLFLHWMARQWGWRDWGRWSEVYGSPIRALKTPAGVDEEYANRFVDELAVGGSGGAIRLPQGATKDEGGYELELLEAKSTGSAGFKDYLHGADAAIAVAILGQTLTTEVTGASLAAAQVHKQIRNDILKGDAQSLGKFFQEQILRPWAEFNFGAGDLAPTPCWNTEPPEDKESVGKSLTAVGQGLTALYQAGVKPDADALTERLGIPVTGPAEEPEPPEPADAATSENEDKGSFGGSKKASIATLSAANQSVAGAIEAQKWTDELVKTSKAAGGDVVARDMLTLMRILDETSSFEDLEGRIVAAYGQMSHARMAELLQRAMVLSDLAGRWGGKKDTE